MQIDLFLTFAKPVFNLLFKYLESDYKKELKSLDNNHETLILQRQLEFMIDFIKNLRIKSTLDLADLFNYVKEEERREDIKKNKRL